MATKRVDPRNKRTRPPKGEGTLTVPFQVYVSEDMKATITDYSGTRGITQGEWVRRAIQAYKVKQDTRKKGTK